LNFCVNIECVTRALSFLTRLSEGQRAALWAIFEPVRAALKARELMTLPEMYARLAAQVAGRRHPEFAFCGAGSLVHTQIPAG